MSLLGLRSTRCLTRPRITRSFHTSLQPRFPRSSGSANSPDVLSFREQVTRTAGPPSFSEHITRPRIRNQVLFAVFGSYLVFTWAAIETNMDTNSWSQRLMDANPFMSMRSPTTREMHHARYLELGKNLQESLSWLKEAIPNFSGTVKSVVVWTYAKAAQYYLDSNEGRRTCWTICAANTAVWLAWQIPRLKPLMKIRFTHHPLSGLSYTLLTSMFSHRSFLHLAFNCMALSSFGSAAITYFTREQSQNVYGMQESTAGYHFGAFFISAGLFSGLVSHVVNARFRFPRLVAELAKPATSAAPTAAATAATATATAINAAKATRHTDILPSLGASGAIYAAVTVTAFAFPDAVVSLIFPPTNPIPIQWGVGGMVLLDMVGIMRGWRLFDHWAHLGGAMFGVMYYTYGPQFWDRMRAVNGGATTPVHPSSVEMDA